MIIQFEKFPAEQYMPDTTEKTQIVLHHTVGSNPAGAINWWKQTIERVAVPFIIDKTGKIYQLFKPKHWAYHLGHGTTAADNKPSIGIEIVNEGPLWIEGKSVKWLDNKQPYAGEIVHADFRGFKAFAAYTDEQIIACAELCDMLCREFNIPKDVVTDFAYDKKHLLHHGIISHHNVRKDKSDVHPGFNFELFKVVLNGR
jgi:N-acetyl-anhydromuramyl-L-alanine amidase AmpD